MLEMALLVVDGNGMVVFWDVFGHPFIRRGSFVVRPVSRNGSFVAESIMLLHVAAEEGTCACVRACLRSRARAHVYLFVAHVLVCSLKATTPSSMHPLKKVCVHVRVLEKIYM